MARIIAVGNVKSDGTIFNSTPGITIDTRGAYAGEMYKVNLPHGLIYHDNYIIQLTQELVDDGDQDHWFTAIGYLYRSKNGFHVGIIRGNNGQYIRGNWSFTLLDL
ncbi:hypothetical protein DFQ10_101478 [Winogradskyella eximia]|jgi:hypothetical protein|uniref:Uncharacterized protein n=1 Tax=Winogradskyella eximia TaxID=262006 RepID=A0A3D9HB45_9FLAO|nr:hypothetical protein [Winogradskyella eximia]RED46705.1 hypothetical protein DFQ10_101478 [Winogradskyella eximia]|tara:strand:- start:200 stop:517 length:318 start_codon:yes stop_codon:yes gene_type:complete